MGPSARFFRVVALAGFAAATFCLGGCGTIKIDPNDPGVIDAFSIMGSDPALLDLQFMSGSWRSLDEHGLSEETWSLPSGTSMVGVFRMVGTEGSLGMQETLAITSESDGVFMRLRHFDSKMAAREDKDSPIVLKLEKAENDRAVFRKVSGSKSLDTIVYQRVDKKLLSEVTFTPESNREALKFEMRRLATQPS